MCFSASIPTPQPPPEYKFPDFPAIEFPAMEFPAPYDSEGAAAKARKADEVKALRAIEQKRKGYASTLITGGEGLVTDPTVRRPSLLGA